MNTRTFGLDHRRIRGREVPLPPRWMRRTLSIAGFLFLWWWAQAAGVPYFQFELFPGPIETLTALVGVEAAGEGAGVVIPGTGMAVTGYLAGEAVLAGEQSIYFHAFFSAFRVASGVVVASLLAIPLGLLVGTSRRWEDYLYPALESLRAIPPVAWVPVSILLFPTFQLAGVSFTTAVIFVVFIGAFFPILVNTVEGVQDIDTEYRRAAESLGADAQQVFRHVVFPAALPSILTGVTLGIGLGWITVVAAEIVGGNYGIGYLTFQAYRLLQTDTVAVGMITIGALGYVSSAIVLWAANRTMPWNEIEVNQ
ncbi:ABC transporter permease [Halobacteriales archaeon QS_4_69_34]|nr:MAG: ABC transporter permease [Halobacteriales archaeon QS_4_69_34]